MKKLLPALKYFFALFLLAFVFASPIFAQAPPTATPAPPTSTPTPTLAATPTPITSGGTTVGGTTPSSVEEVCQDNLWCKDAAVTFAGKMAARANDFLTFSLVNYQWSDVAPGKTNPLESFWFTIVTQVVAPFFLLIVLISAFVLVITRGKNLTIKQFIARFMIIAVASVLSYAVLRLCYQLADLIQGFFLDFIRGKPITAKDLLFVGLNYSDFIGFRIGGAAYDESAFISLLLIKLTTVTYFVMSGILLVRKIILWFFIAVSPIFPLLLLYTPVRNTAKIWVGEFLRWLLYAPLFAILLSGLVALWASPAGIPLDFDNFPNTTAPVEVSKLSYPTAINILIGGPGQAVSLTNNINTPQTFAQYVIALLMLWAVIILPFVLLQIFLNYINNYNFGESPVFQQILSKAMLKDRGSPPSPISPSPSPTSSGIARALPFANKTYVSEEAPATTGMARSIPTQATNQSYTNISNRFSTPVSQINMSQTPSNTEVLRLANLFVPTLRDVARFETATHTSDVRSSQQVTQMKQTLERIANPSIISSATEKQRYDTLREQLVVEKQKGNPVAAAVLSASGVTNISQSQSTTGGQVVTADGKPVEATQQQKTLIDTSATFPVVNRVQSVNLDDYEAVRKMWVENYQKLDPPKANGVPKPRKDWVKDDIANITNVISLLTSQDSKAKKEGMDKVANILPFLLIGGFSQTEVIAYLKSKLEAAKSVSAELAKKDDEEATTLDTTTKKTEQENTMHMSASAEVAPPENPAVVDEKTTSKSTV